MSEPIRYEFIYNENFCSVEREEHPEGDYVRYEDYARLKAEVERLKAEPDALTAYLYADTLRRDDIKTLKAHIERLTKAGDAMAAEIIDCYRAEGYDPADSETIPKWNAAKEGKQS